MNKFYSLVFSILLSFTVSYTIAQSEIQDKPGISIGKVEPEDFNISKIKVDTSQGAVILADIGSSGFKGNQKGWFSLIFKHQIRILILNPKGYDLASKTIPLFKKDDDAEKLENVKGITYNLVNGEVIETKMGVESVVTDKIDNEFTYKKFTLPQVRPGSILEYTYEINSDFIGNLQPWKFQSSFPCLWSEYSIDIPYVFEYVFFKQSSIPYYINTVKNKSDNYRIVQTDKTTESYSSDITQFPTVNTVTRWVMKDLPAFKEENYLSSAKNYESGIEFQLTAYNFHDHPHDNKLGDWNSASKILLENKQMGAELILDNAYLNSSLNPIKQISTNPLFLAHNTYQWVQKSFTCTGNQGKLMDKSIRECFNRKSGSTAEINMVLVAMLRHEKLDAHPLILSTRNNGFARSKYPILSQYNYLVAMVYIDGKSYVMDASFPDLGFNKLDEECYNGIGHIINSESEPITLSADSLTESQFTNVLLTQDEKNTGNWTGKLSQQMGYFESTRQREKIRTSGKEKYLKDYKTNISKPATGEFSINNLTLIQETNFDEPMKIEYDFSIKEVPNSNLIYFLPVWVSNFTKNPFTSATRHYPVEMNSKLDQIYNFQMDIPQGFQVDEMPKSTRVKLNESDGIFEYLISNSGTQINLRTRIKLNKATFASEDYESLRNFFSFISRKFAEQIIFKKL